MHMAPLLLLFFVSGFAALAYEVVWIRLLSLTLSVTVYALTTVLCAFMAGLGLGAALAARFADRLRRPLVAFGLCELGIALSGLVVPAVLFELGPAYVWLRDALGSAGVGFVLARFALAFSVLLVPTTLMGMTLPFLGRVAIDREGAAGRGVGALYAANTIGAVTGCVAAGFLIVPELGLRATSLCAAAANVAIAVSAIAAGRRRATAAVAAPSRSRRPMSVPARLACFAFAVSGFTAMGYELLWTRSLEHFTHNSTYAYSAMLATFLAGIGVGSAVLARPADRVRSPLLWLGLTQLGVAATVLASLRILMHFETWVPAVAAGMGGLTSWGRVVALIFGEATVTMFATTLCFGAAFPLVARVVVDSLGDVGERVGLAYLANTVGSILGSLLVGFVALPALGIRGAFVVLVAMNLLVGSLLALRHGGRAGLVATAVAVATLAASFVIVPPSFLEQQFIERFGVLRFYREEVTDTIMVTEAPDGERMIRYGDGRGTAGTWTAQEDRMYAHIPMLLHPNPRRILQIGFGVGNTLASVVTYPVESAVCVELSPGVVDAAPYFRSTNRDVLDDPRIRLAIEDGRNFLLASHDRYDVIRLDPPELHTAGVVNLYTREFYQMARDHLMPGGIFSIWVNTVLTPEDGLRKIAATLQSVFPHVSVWHGPAAYSWVLNGSMEPHAPDLGRLMERFSIPAVRDDLASIGIADPYRFLAHFVFADDDVRAFAGDASLVTDDHTQLDFQTPRSADSFYGIANINTDNWLVQLIEPGAKGDLAGATFLRKVASLAHYKRPVAPLLVNVEAAGLAREEVAARIDASRSTTPR